MLLIEFRPFKERLTLCVLSGPKSKETRYCRSATLMKMYVISDHKAFIQRRQIWSERLSLCQVKKVPQRQRIGLDSHSLLRPNFLHIFKPSLPLQPPKLSQSACNPLLPRIFESDFRLFIFPPNQKDVRPLSRLIEGVLILIPVVRSCCKMAIRSLSILDQPPHFPHLSPF